MSFSKIPIFLITFLWSLSVSSQRKQQGIIIFEGQQNVFELYFIKTSTKSLISFLKTKDTVTAIYLGMSGEAANTIDDFKNYLNETIRFDTLSIVIAQKNHLGREYETSSLLLSSFGDIKYHKGKGVKLVRTFKKLYLNNKSVIIVLEVHNIIDSFTSTATKTK